MAFDSTGASEFAKTRTAIAILAVSGIIVHFIVRYLLPEATIFGIPLERVPLLVVLLVGGTPLVLELLGNLFRGEFGSDLLAGISIVTSLFLGEYLAGAFVVLMLSGGEALESYAVRSASSVLEALAKRMPAIVHRKLDGKIEDIALKDVNVGDTLVVFPHEICPVDGTVVEGHGVMDESYLTGEPYRISKAPGTAVLSGAINGDAAMTVRADRRAEDSRYAKIMLVMRDSEQRRPRLRRLGDQLGAWYTPLAVTLAILAWLISGQASRFLAVLVVATPCPLLIAIPVAIIGAVSLAARRGIVIKDPAVLEKVDTCRVAIFDKTGTLTYGQPAVTKVNPLNGFTANEVLGLTAELERYSRHPLAHAIVDAAGKAGLPVHPVERVEEKPGQGLTGQVSGRSVRVTGRPKLLGSHPEWASQLPPSAGGLECVVLIDEKLAGTITFRDRPRDDGKPFIHHLSTRHHFQRVMLLSGDRESEVRYLADQVGIKEVYASQTPEQKLDIVRRETESAATLFVGDGVNDAPALTAATVGLAFGQNTDVTAEAAGAVILDADLKRVDEFFHISNRLRSIALQSAVGGMALSIGGMLLAAFGILTPVAGAIAQEAIDMAAVLNALRTSWEPERLTDY